MAFLEGEGGPAGKVEIGIAKDLRDQAVGRDQIGLGALPMRSQAGHFSARSRASWTQDVATGSGTPVAHDQNLNSLGGSTRRPRLSRNSLNSDRRYAPKSQHIDSQPPRSITRSTMTRSSLSITCGSSRSYSQSRFRTWGGSTIKSLYQNDLSTIGIGWTRMDNRPGRVNAYPCARTPAHNLNDPTKKGAKNRGRSRYCVVEKGTYCVSTAFATA